MEEATERHDGMSVEEFRKAGHALVDWICEYRLRASQLPVRSRVEPGYLSKKISLDIPEDGEVWEAIMSDVDQAIVPGLTHWESSRFFAYFKPHASFPSVLGELLSAGLNVMGFSWIASPACTELETIACDMLGKTLSLPPTFLSTSGVGGGVIQGSAGEAAIVVLLAARSKLLQHIESDAERATACAKLTVYVSDQTHIIIEKACTVVGIPARNLRKLTTEAAQGFVLSPEALDAAIQQDRDLGLLPAFVCATLGTTTSTAIDPVEAIGAVARKHGVWLHVDAAYGGAYAVCPEYAFLMAGMDLAQLTPRLQDRRPVVAALSQGSGEYLRNAATASGAVIDYKDWQLPLGRRFRALKLWFTLRSFGRRGLQAHIRNGVAIAAQVEALVRANLAFELVAPRVMALVVFRLRGSDERNQALLDELNRRGNIFIIHSRLGGQLVLRLAIGGIEATSAAAMEAWEEICLCAQLV